MRKIILLPIFLLFIQFSWAHPDQEAVEKALYNLKNVRFKQLPNSDPTLLYYELFINQLIDHKNPEKGSFEQKVHFIHRGFNQPTIMETNGYDLYIKPSELTHYLKANYLNIEHRFFGKSVPEGNPWEYLTLEQVTTDLHEINALFRELYKGKWISTGVSKGGQTTLYYRYFYPRDVDVSIPYVAPFNHSMEEPRIYSFLNEVGTKACRTKIRDLQTYLFKNKKAILEKLNWYSQGARLKFKYVGSLEKAFEYAVLEYDFSFWQSGTNCQDIPVTKDMDTVVAHFLSVSNVDFYSDATIDRFAPHFYQAGTEMGYYGYDITPFKKYVSFKKNPSATFMPPGTSDKSFSPKLINEVKQWLEENGNNFLYIYGGTDTWTASQVIPSKNVNSKSFVIPNKDHYQARIKNMDPQMQNEFFEALKNLSGVEKSMVDER